MRLSTAINAAGSVLAARLLGRRVPLAVGWELTHRCNHRCSYCLTCNAQTPELSQAQLLRMLTDMHRRGCRVVAFTGGEALLVRGIDELMERARALGMVVMLTSNGALVPQKIDAVAAANEVQLNLDGPKEIHDRLREPGMFDETMQAVQVLQDRGVKVALACVVTSLNVDRVPQILDMAAKLGLPIAFQPVSRSLTDLVAPAPGFCQAMTFLLSQKRAGNRSVGQSTRVLQHLRHWPAANPVSCAAGKIYCRIDPQGYVAPCNMVYQEQKAARLNAAEVGFCAAFDGMELMSCDTCWHHSRLDLNFLYNLDPGTILEVARQQLR